MPERFHLGHLGEETVPAEVEAPAVPEHGAADTADDVVGLEHDRLRSPFGQEVGGRESSGARARDDDAFALSCSHDRARLADPPGCPLGALPASGVRSVRRAARRTDGNQGTEMLRKASRE